MQLALPGQPHLTYCTNIHPGESLSDVRQALLEHVTRVKERVGRPGRFGVGLRLSALAAEELAEEREIESFRALLDQENLYLFTVNGFPYGAFHGTKVKENVYRPDWLEDDRIRYSDRLAWILAHLLPEGVHGSVSTVPVAFRPRIGDPRGILAASDSIARHVATLFRIREQTGKLVELALEPEPACFLETTDEAVHFFEGAVFSAETIARLAGLAGLSSSDAEAVLRRHAGVCVDACHLAVEFETARESLARLSGAGIRIGKLQITAALSVALSGDPGGDEAALAALERFDDGIYLHQVVERGETGLVRYLDLPEALHDARSGVSRGAREWRVHFHVPVFHDRLPPFDSTQPFLREILGSVRQAHVSDHLEVETYTWDVLPAAYRAVPVDDAIARELAWTLAELGQPESAPVPGTP